MDDTDEKYTPCVDVLAKSSLSRVNKAKTLQLAVGLQLMRKFAGAPGPGWVLGKITRVGNFQNYNCEVKFKSDSGPRLLVNEDYCTLAKAENAPKGAWLFVKP